MIDDLQWSDEDSLRLLRYVVRTDGASPIFLMFAIRPEEFAVVNEAVNLIADMDRMGVVRRLKLEPVLASRRRASSSPQVLGGPVDAIGRGGDARAGRRASRSSSRRWRSPTATTG